MTPTDALDALLREIAALRWWGNDEHYETVFQRWVALSNRVTALRETLGLSREQVMARYEALRAEGEG